MHHTDTILQTISLFRTLSIFILAARNRQRPNNIMRGATSLLYSIPRRGRLPQESPTLSNRPTGCSISIGTSGQETRSEPTSVSLHSDAKRTLEPNNAGNTPTPILLLEGDEFFLSSKGVARTYYELAISEQSRWKTPKPLALEEHYDLKGSKKTFTLRRGAPDAQDQDVTTHGKRSAGIKLMGSRLAQLDLQEIVNGVLGTAGTGATTWEASIAMALFWSSHAELLLGDVIELGSGVGLGGILSGLVGRSSPDSRLTSMTLTDHNPEVLEQCRENVLKSEQATNNPFHLATPCSIAHLDWYDFLSDSSGCDDHREQYDTVIASDCAYRYQDLVALTRAMKALLKPTSSSRIHFFGPYNRGALHDLVRLLQNEKMDVVTEYIDMKRYRLQPHDGHSKASHLLDRQHVEISAFASQTTSKFLHAIATYKPYDPTDFLSSQISMAEID